MIFHSEVLTGASGSVGGVTYAHNRSGMYRRARSIPVNPNSAFQVQVRAGLTELVNRWTSVLSPAQRAAWDLYALNVPVTNALGSAINISGQNWYIAANTPRAQLATKLGMILVGNPTDPFDDAAPVIFDRGDFTTPTVTSDVSSGTIVAFNDADAWNGGLGSALMVYQGRPRNASVTFFNGPWRLIAAFNNSATTPQTIAPATIAANGFPYAVGQKVMYAFAVTASDGRLTTRRNVDTTVIA